MATKVNNLVEFMQAGETLLANDAVYVDPVNGKLFKLDVTDNTKNKYFGIVKDAGDLDDWVRVVQAGKARGFTGLTPGQPVYASTTVPGALTLTQPTNVAETVILGTAKNSGDLIVNAALSVPFASGDGSGGGVGGVDILFVQTFEDAKLADFTQTGLVLSDVNPLSGEVSARLTHQAAINQLFKEVIAVDEKFRGRNITLKLNIKSAASAGNVTLTVVDETNAVTLVNSEQLPVSNDVGGAIGQVSFDMPDDCLSFSYEVVALPEAGSPVTIVDDVIAEITSLIDEQSVLVQEADEIFRATLGAVATGSTNTRVLNINFNIQENNLSSVSIQQSAILGTTFTILEEGLYTFKNDSNIVTNAYLGFTKNTDGSLLSTGIETSGLNPSRMSIDYDTSAGTLSTTFTAPLKAGDVIRLMSSGAVSAGATNDSSFIITRHGSLKQVNPNPNSKITIPTSELRMEGASTRGSTATAIVRFDNIAKLRGDAFEVLSDATLGTRIVMKKKGKLGVYCSLHMPQNLTSVITRNQSNLSGFPTASEALSRSGTGTGATAFTALSWMGDVNVGDVIRISAEGTPISVPTNNLNLSFQEQDIAVSVTNTLPQFSESDSSVRVDTANGYGSTGTRIRRFSNVRDNIGNDIEYVPSAVNGDSFVVKSAGIYHVSYDDDTGTTSYIGVSKDASSLTTGIQSLPAAEILCSSANSDSTFTENVAWSGYLQAGATLRAQTSSGSGMAGYARFTISKVGKPQVTGVDVTPFVNIPQPESQSSRHFIATWTGGGVIAAPVQTSKGSDIYSYNSSTGLFTVLKPCNITLTLTTLSNASGTFAVPLIQINGVSLGSSISAAELDYSATTAWTGTLNVGDIFNFSSGTGGTQKNVRGAVLATALSDQIITPPETFSTDTNNLTYAPSSLYTLSTLADAPVGTFITFTYAANTNTRTQTTTAPTQTTADMNLNGMRIFTRPYNATSTAAEPSVFAIQVGKGFKGRTVDIYKGIGKDVQGSVDAQVISSVESKGCGIKEYNERTGVLVVDCGFLELSTITTSRFTFADGTSQTSGYLVINASKSPLKMGFGIASDTSAKLGLDPDKFITPKTLRSGLNANGEAPVYACRAWVNFNGTGTVAIRASGNVSSITDNGVGDYTVNFTTPMEDVNYTAFGSAGESDTNGRVRIFTKSTDSVRVQSRSSTSGTTYDDGNVNVSVFR
jgi:hypothetical protein